MLGQAVAEPIGAPVALVRQHLLGRRALGCHAKLRADRVGRLLGHQPVCRQLAADDRYEVIDPVANVIEDDVCPRDRPPVVVLGRPLLLVQRPDAGIGAEQAHPRQVGEELRALGEQQGDLFAADAIDIRVFDRLLCRAKDRHRVDGHHDVAVVGPVTAVDHRVGHPLVEHEHRAFARRHRQMDARETGDQPGPRARGRNDDPRQDGRHTAAPLVDDLRAEDPAA